MFAGRHSYHAINRLLTSGNSWNIVQRTLGCSRSTISSAIKHAARTAMPTQSATLDGVAKKSVAIILWLLVENGSQFTRGKKAVREQIAGMLLTRFRGKRVNDTETRLVIQFTDDADLKAQIDEMLAEIHQMADFQNCEIIDLTLQEETTGRYWDEYNGGWN